MRLYFITTLLLASALGMPLPINESLLLPNEEVIVEQIIVDTEVDVEVEVAEPEYITVNLPHQENNSFKTYMDYRMITNTTSGQWAMQQEAYTDENGLRKIDDYYCVALGSGISDKLGKKFKITLESGETFGVIMAEQKADRHTDPSNRYIDRGNGSINVVEFIVETETMPSIVTVMGDVSHMPGNQFAGNIIAMEEIVE